VNYTLKKRLLSSKMDFWKKAARTSQTKYLRNELNSKRK
jgi:hypothetical protein